MAARARPALLIRLVTDQLLWQLEDVSVIVVQNAKPLRQIPIAAARWGRAGGPLRFACRFRVAGRG